MKLTLRSQPTQPNYTLGSLYVNDVFECFTLEDTVRVGAKVFGKTAIPAGVYGVDITYSPHFGRNLPLLVNVPNFEGVRIHPGNTDADTEGCILVGTTESADFIGNSRVAFEALFAKLDAAHTQHEPIVIEIIR